MIARSADFYGPDTQNGVPNVLVFEPFAKGAKASWLVNSEVPHSLTFTSDAAYGVAMLAEKESAWNQVWHLPTAPNPPTGREFIAMAAGEFGVAPKYRVLSRPMLRLAGWFNPQVRESYEDAVSERFSLPVRLDKVRERIRLRGNFLSGRSPNRCRFL
jgi:nucleoside-diphosphate-sugar epimerase